MLSRETINEILDKLQRCYGTSNRMILKMYDQYFPVNASGEEGRFIIGQPLLKSEIKNTDIIYDAEEIKNDIDEYISEETKVSE